MARGSFGSAGSGAVLGGNLGTGAAGGGIARRAGEVSKAGQAVASGGNVVEAVGRVQNAGGGELKVNKTQVADVLALTPRKVMADPNGAVLFDVGALTGLPELKGDLKMYDRRGKEMPMDRTVTVMVQENGVSGIRMATKTGTFKPINNEAPITPEQRASILAGFLPPQLQNARLNAAGQINGFKISPEAVPDKATRAALYRNTGRDGVIRFSPNSPVAKALSGMIPERTQLVISKVTDALGNTTSANLS